MVYYGAASKGCERCRKRKVKCDQKRPRCLKCVKIGVTCPGYRDLNDVVFRDESQRILRNIRRQNGIQASDLVNRPQHVNAGGLDPPGLKKTSRTPICDLEHDLGLKRQYSGREDLLPSAHTRPGSELIYPLLKPPKDNTHEGVQGNGEALVVAPGPSSAPSGALTMSPSLSKSIEDLGANFFFTKYAFDMPPFYKGYDTWLSQTYFGGNSILTAIIEAIGMAGLANTTNSTPTMTSAHRRYQQSIARVNEALNDPVEGKTDEAFMAVILLAFFETVSFQNWDRYNNWLDHIKAATALLELRGKAQFSRQRGAQLFIQVRSQILLACVQQRLTVPPAVVQATYYFETGSLRERLKAKYAASPASISEMSLRIVNLRAAAKNNRKSIVEIAEAAHAIDADLIMWADVAPKQWRYTTEKDSGSGDNFRGKKHVYEMPWCVEIWNNWRILRIAAKQIMVQNDGTSFREDDSRSMQLIKEMSADICISVSVFSDYRRVLSLIRPLYVVATEPRCDRDARNYAVRHLRRLGLEMGVRQPVLLADKIQEYMEEEETKGGVSRMECDTFLLSGPY